MHMAGGRPFTAPPLRRPHVPPCVTGPNFNDFLTGDDIKAKYSVQAPSWTEKKRKPDWMKRTELPSGDKYTGIKAKLRELKLSTVCEEAK